jgi:secondary thiamine-phosphate synthase enzyme
MVIGGVHTTTRETTSRMKVFNTSFTVSTEAHTEVSDITKLVRDALQESSITTGIALVNTMHTTCALFVNEYQHSLMEDLVALGERLVPERGGFRHDDPRYSDCERGNAHAHLRTALLGRSVAVPVNQGELTLGRFQSIIFSEFDGPRSREISVQILGEA